MPSYADLNSVDNPTTGQPAPAAWGDQVRDNFEAMRNPFRCAVNNGFENVTDGTGGPGWTVTFANELYDTDSMFGGPSSIITIQHSGYYDIRATAEWQSNPTGHRFLQCGISPSTSLGDTDIDANQTSKTDMGLVLPIRHFNATDQIIFIVHQTSGITLQCLVAASILFVCP